MQISGEGTMRVAVLPSWTSDRGASCWSVWRPYCVQDVASGPAVAPSLRRLTVGPDHCELVSRWAAVPWCPSLTVERRGARRRGWCGGFALHEVLWQRVAGVSHPHV